LLGITAGVVLAVMGVTGAVLSFEHELLRWLNPGVLTVTPRVEGPLSPPELIARAQAAYPEKRITGFNFSTDPEEAARVGFAADSGGAPGSQATQEQRRRPGSPSGGRRSEWRYVDPYTGALLGEPRGQEFFRVITELHRWLAVGEVGKAITGASTIALVVLCGSGLYLRWPRRRKDWRVWLTFDFARKGRGFLWHVHAVTGTWVLIPYLLAGLTGLFWSYEWYRNGLFVLTGASPPNRDGTRLDAPAQDWPDLTAIWRTLQRETNGFSTVSVTLPERPTQAVEIRYLDSNPAHERAFNQLTVHPVSGEVIRHDRYVERPFGGKLVSSMFVLHSGSFLGVVGLTLMMAASLLMPLFAITGWQLYLLQRRALASGVRAYS
jgi:sulfite reductase (NADPH) flavoprotein alpha-component